MRKYRHSSRGFSLVEALISILILGVIALGILPALSGAVALVNRGQEATVIAREAETQMETLTRVPRTVPQVEVPIGLTELTNDLIWITPEDGEMFGAWEEPAFTNLLKQREWNMTTTIQNHSLNDLDAGVGGLSEFDTPLTGGTAPNFVHFACIEVAVTGERQAGALGAGQQHTFTICNDL